MKLYICLASPKSSSHCAETHTRMKHKAVSKKRGVGRSYCGMFRRRRKS
jgi:hypothetical protein